jgi:hypothetical protein
MPNNLDYYRKRAPHCVSHHNACDCRELERREEIAALKAVVREMLEQGHAIANGHLSGKDRCIWCGYTHNPGRYPDCLGERARKLSEEKPPGLND